MTQKIIVTHISPDFDGIPAIWLLKRFHPDFKTAKVAFVPVGEATYNNEPVDSNPNVFHVDTGGGKFDHHKTNDFTCGAKLVYEWLVAEGYSKEDLALERLVNIVTQIDHGWDHYKWCEPADDRNEFFIHNILVGWKIIDPHQNEKYVDWILHVLDAIYKMLQLKVRAEIELKEALNFKTRWGMGAAVFTQNDMVMDVAINCGLALVVRKDPKGGNIRITGSNNHKVDLTRAYQNLKAKDPAASWFLHASKVLLRNGSSRNPEMKASKLQLKEVVEILEKS